MRYLPKKSESLLIEKKWCSACLFTSADLDDLPCRNCTVDRKDNWKIYDYDFEPFIELMDMEEFRCCLEKTND